LLLRWNSHGHTWPHLWHHLGWLLHDLRWLGLGLHLRLGHSTWLTIGLSRVRSSLRSILEATHVVLSKSGVSVELVHNELNDLEDLWFVEDVWGESRYILFFMILEISLVSSLFLLNLSYFLEFVVVDVEGLTIEALRRYLLLSHGSMIW
jgi:hypothetical protein